jgi:hypothetical protein
MVIVKFYKLNEDGNSFVCRTELCASLLEADFYVAEEMQSGQYTGVTVELEE